MVLPPESSHPQSQGSPMAKPSIRHKTSSWITDTFLFFGGALVAFLLVWTLWSSITPSSIPRPSFERTVVKPKTAGRANLPSSLNCAGDGDIHSSAKLSQNSSEKTFYDDPQLSYSIGNPVKNWDYNRREWLKNNPSFVAGAENRILMVTGSQPSACTNPIGDHLLLRFFKNKVDYCRIQGYDIFYNNALLHPKMGSYWAKLPVVRAAMMAHPEAEWIWWVDSDAAITDMEFKLPLEKYKNHNLIVHGWAHLIQETHSWTGLNAGVLLIRNCQWVLDFMEVWAQMGPQSPDYEKWGKIQRSIFPDKTFPESDDQTGLAYLLYKEKEKWADKIYLENGYYFEGYWVEIVGKLDNITERYREIERGDERLRRRHAEKVSDQYGAFRENENWRRPFITHFTGCQPCSGNHNEMYSGESCWDGMQKVLNFADNQVMRTYGFMHPHLLDSSVSVVSFDYPA